MGRAVDNQRPSHHLRVAAETELPEPVAEHQHVLVPGRRVFLPEPGAKGGAYAQNPEEAGRHDGAAHQLRPHLPFDGGGVHVERCHAVERGAPPFPLGVVATRHGPVRIHAALILPDHDKTGSVRVRKRPEIDRVGYGEGRGRRGDAEADGSQGRHGKPRLAEEGSERKPCVPQDRVDHVGLPCRSPPAGA